MKLKEHPKIKKIIFQNRAGGCWYTGAEKLPSSKLSNWVLADIDSEYDNHLKLITKATDTGHESSESIWSDDKNILEHLKQELSKHMGKTLEQIGNLEIDTRSGVWS